MTTTRKVILLASAACTLVAACGGGSDEKPASFREPTAVEIVAKANSQSPRRLPPAASPVVPAPLQQRGPQVPPPLPAAASVTRAHFNPDSIPAAQIAASLAQFANAMVDEKSCTRGYIACDETYSAQANSRLHGTVGRLLNEDGQVYFDSEDFVQLPITASPLSIFIESNAESKDMLLATLEDRLGNRLYTLPPLQAGKSTAFGWTRTDDASAAPYRLRLHVPTGAGDHSVMYMVLPIQDTPRRSAARSP